MEKVKTGYVETPYDPSMDVGDGDFTIEQPLPPKDLNYPGVKGGEWVQPVPAGYRMACCDCGLVHELDFRIHEGRVQMRGKRNNRSTAALRRNRSYSHKKP
jgi:hypothetical protein